MPHRCIKPLCDTMECVMCNCAIPETDVKLNYTKAQCRADAVSEAEAGGPDCSAGAPARGLVERLRDSSGGHINGLYDREAADEIERLTELADSEGTRAVKYLRRARKAEAEVALLRAALSEVLDVVSLPREPNWAYRNTITTNKDRIKAACRAGLGLD